MPRILLTSKSDIGLAFIPWAQERYKLRSGIWYDAPHEKVLIQYNTVAGTILIKAESGQNLVCNPYKTDKDNYSSHFFLDATKDKIFSTETDESWKENLPTDVEVELVDEALFGNYVLSDSDGNNYSIIAPIHHLANEPDNKILIPSYTRYAWTTNVTAVDIYTCYSEYVYSGGEAVFRGTFAPPEAAFQSALIVGVGLDSDDNIHVAQLSGIGKDIGYWTILNKNKVSVGVYFGSEDGAKTEAGKLEEGTYSKIWKNETGNMWFIEFHSTNCSSLTGLLPADLNIYRREPTNRIGANRQWFFDKNTGTWSQYTTTIKSTLTFEGLSNDGAYKKTVYRISPNESKLFGKDILFSHLATSSSGVSGIRTEVKLPVKEIPYSNIQISKSADWPNDGSYILVLVNGSACVTFEMNSTIPNTTLVEIEPRKEYRYVLNNRCVPNQSAKSVSGLVTVTSSTGDSQVFSEGYVTASGAWYSVSTEYNPYYSTGFCDGPIVPTYSGSTLITLYTSRCAPSGYFTSNKVMCLCDNYYGPGSGYVYVYSEPPHLTIGPTEWDYYVGELCPDNSPIGACISPATPCFVYNNYPDYCMDNYYPVVVKTVHEWRC